MTRRLFTRWTSTLRRSKRPPSVRCRLRPRLDVLEDRLAPAADVLVNDNAGATSTSRFTQSDTTLVAFDDTVLVGFMDTGSGSAGSWTGWSRSTNGGASFTDRGAMLSPDVGNPVMARNNMSGRIYFANYFSSSSSALLFQVARSDDGGATWMTPVNATPGGSNEAQEWLAVDNFAGPGSGNVYLIAVHITAAQYETHLFRSTDNGATFAPSGGIILAGGVAVAPYVAVGPDHTVYAFWFDSTTSPSRIRMRKSTDQGIAFDAATTVATVGSSSPSGDLGLTGIRQGTTTPASFSTNCHPRVAINPVSGHIYVTYNDDSDGIGPDKATVLMVQSTDSGASWSTPTRINDDSTTTDQWFPALAVSPDGTKLGIFYYSRQEDAANNNQFKYYARIGDISGTAVNFGPSFAVSDVASLPEFGRDAVLNSTYIGEYNQVVATNSAFHVVWSDNRDDLAGGAPRKDPNVYYDAIPIAAHITASTPAGAVNPPVSSVAVNFSSPMDQSSFSIAQDLFAFTGPAGNLLPFVTGFAWVTAQQLRIEFNAQTIPGAYAMTLNPSIRSLNGNPLDNNRNYIPGEIPADRYTANFSISGSPANNFGYRWATTPFNPTLNIQPGQPGVSAVTFTDSQDDDFATVSLGSSTFNFYGTTFTSVFVGTNGIIGFTGGVTDFANTDLTTSPTQSVFCPLWDDLHIGYNTATDDLVLT
jgi:BNR repeat-like domain